MATTKSEVAKADYADLNSKYETLTQEKDALTADLETAKSDLGRDQKDLDKVKKDLEAEQSSLTKVQGEQAKLQANADKAVKYLEVMVHYWIQNTGPDAVEKAVKAVDDPELVKKYDAYVADPDKFIDWVKYIFVTISDLLQTK